MRPGSVVMESRYINSTVTLNVGMKTRTRILQIRVGSSLLLRQFTISQGQEDTNFERSPKHGVSHIFDFRKILETEECTRPVEGR